MIIGFYTYGCRIDHFDVIICTSYHCMLIKTLTRPCAMTSRDMTTFYSQIVVGPTLVSNGKVDFSLITQSFLGGNYRNLCITPQACLSGIFSVSLASLVLFTLMTATLHKYVCLHLPNLRYHSHVETSSTWLVQEQHVLSFVIL